MNITRHFEGEENETDPHRGKIKSSFLEKQNVKLQKYTPSTVTFSVFLYRNTSLEVGFC